MTAKRTKTAHAPSPRAPFPFSRAMAFGLGVLRLAPRDFWSMTPRELHRAMEGVYGRGGGAPSRATLDELMREFPDARPPK
ncbi:phage tail assembly chaperone [Methylocystis sp. WRRC1]|uniref:rcc01693 family protein n=1 Tax=Methylocystis sp. WRRC1 TaxID=1732014 RepID=UPI001D139A45|nr:rcc01693 family protein [Methylocystis sp. WRRC1]MCC3244687.1 phage tail assembly chaperone [Methylocystis sp. WRRC1]